MKPTYRISWDGNLLMWSDLTLSPSFKVKQWFTGFVELSFQCIQICIRSPMRRSSYPTALKVCWGIVFTHGVQLGGQAEKSLSGLYLRNRKV